MSIRDILVIPEPLLRTSSTPVDKVDTDVHRLLDDMLATMYAAPGIGLAAIQIGVPKRIVTIDLSKDETARDPLYFINPEIVWTSDDTAIYEEGCLSIPEFYGEVERPERCRVRYLDREGTAQEIECDGLLATCIQHEIDHLNGVLFIDYLSKLKRDRVVKKFSKIKKRSAA